MVLDLAIHAKEPTEACIQKLALGVCEAEEEMAKLQLLKLQINRLQLKA